MYTHPKHSHTPYPPFHTPSPPFFFPFHPLPTQKSYTPVHVASGNGNEDCLRVLIENGGDVNAVATVSEEEEYGDISV